MGTTSGYITKNQELIINMDAANSRSYTSGSASCNCLVSSVSGTLEGGTSFTSEYKGGWVFGGSNDYINLGNRTKINPELNSFTTNIFFKIDSNSTSSSIIASKGNGADSDIGWLIYYSNTNNILTVRCNGNNTTSERAAQYTSINKGQVYMVTMVINRTDNTIKGYLNGSNVGWSSGNYVQAFTGNSISGFGSITNSNDFLIGERPQLNLPMYGTIYLFQTYNFALSEAQVYRNFRFFGGRYDLSVPPPPPTFFNDYSFDFDGTDDYIDCGVISDLQSVTEFSISCWFKRTINVGKVGVFKWYANSTGTWIELSVASDGSGNVIMSNGGLTYGTYAVASVDDETWYHAVMVFDGGGTGNSGRLKLYLNSADKTLTFTGTIPSSSAGMESSSFQIGRRFTTIDEFGGDIDETSIWSTALSSSQVSAFYNSGTPTDLTGETGLVAWYRMGDNGIYKSPQWLLPENSNKDKVSNYSMSFDGTDDYIECGYMTELDNVSAFTLSVWLKFDNLTGTQRIMGKWYSSAYHISLATIGGEFYPSINGYYNATNNANLVAGTWYHIAMIFDGTLAVAGNRLKLYVDGVAKTFGTTGSIPATTYDFALNPSIFYLGTDGYGLTPNYFGGIYDEASVFNSAKDIGVLWDGTGKPTNLAAESGLVAWYRMGENGTFKSTQWLMPNNENKDKFSNYSMSFDGTDDYISIPTSDNNILPGATTMTVSLWWKREVYDGNLKNLIGYYNAGPFRVRQWQHMLIFEVSDNSNWVGWEGATIQTNTASPLAVSGVWHNIVCTWESATNEMRAYINGVECDASPSTTTISALYSGVAGTDPNLNIMKNTSQGGYGKGEISDISIWDKVLTSGERTSLFNSGVPSDLSNETGLVGYWKMGDDAIFNTNWTITDASTNSNDGTSVNMDIYDRLGESPGSSGNTVSYNMDIYDRVGDAPNSENNALSYNMGISGRTTNVPT